MRINKLLIVTLVFSFLFSSCKKEESIDPETCPHEHLVLDEEVEPTPESDGYTSGHHCKRCNKKIDGYDVIKYGQLKINNETAYTISRYTSSFEVNNISFQAGNIKRADNFLTLQNHGVLTNISPVYKIKSLSFDISSTKVEVYLTLGHDALPFLNEERIIDINYRETFDEHHRYFLISNHDVNEVTISNLEMTYFYLEKGEEETTLPNIEIKTNGGQPIVSRDEYVESTVSVTDPNNSENNLVDAPAGIRVRGNSTSGEDKKPYRIKFDKKQSMFGLTKAKNWVLLAEYYDPTTMHNYIAQSIIGMLNDPKVVLHPIHVTVTVNGKYQGLYVFLEQPDEKEGRVNIEQELTTDMDVSEINFLIEQDGRAYESGPENITYITVNGTYYEIKYPEIDEFPDYDANSNSSNMFNRFINHLKDLLTQAWNAMNSRSLAKIMNLFDMNSLYNQSILDVYSDERDHSWLSIKMFRDKEGKINFGPCWDYDIVAWGTIWSGSYYANPFKDQVQPTYQPSNEWLNVIASKIDASKDEFKARMHAFLVNHQQDILNLFHQEFGYIANEAVKNGIMWYEKNIAITYENVRFFEHYLNVRYLELLSIYS